MYALWWLPEGVIIKVELKRLELKAEAMTKELNSELQVIESEQAEEREGGPHHIHPYRWGHMLWVHCIGYDVLAVLSD